MKKVKKVNESQFWQVVGLLALAKKAEKQLAYIEEAIADTLGIEGEYGSYGHISDMVYGAEKKSAEELLKKEGIEMP